MDHRTQEAEIAAFTSYHHFAIPDWLKVDEAAVIWLTGAKTAIARGFSSQAERLLADGEPSWALLNSMSDRVLEHASAAVVCFFTGSWASLEVVVRAAIEACVNVIYIASSDRSRRLGQYLGDYFAATRRRLERREQTKEVVEALRALDWREDLFRRVVEPDGINLEPTGWPSTVKERFSAVGMERDYQDVYAVLSSQAHNDADSLVDYAITKCVSAPSVDSEAEARVEMLYWMRCYMYSCLTYYVRASDAVARAYGWSDTCDKLRTIENQIRGRLAFLSDQFHGDS